MHSQAYGGEVEHSCIGRGHDHPDFRNLKGNGCQLKSKREGAIANRTWRSAAPGQIINFRRQEPASAIDIYFVAPIESDKDMQDPLYVGGCERRVAFPCN